MNRADYFNVGSHAVVFGQSDKCWGSTAVVLLVLLLGTIKCVFLNNQPCKARPTLVNMNSDETLFYLFAVNINYYGGNCNTINDPYARVCFPNKLNIVNVKLFNVMSEVNETRFLVQYEQCESKCGLNESAYTSKQK